MFCSLTAPGRYACYSRGFSGDFFSWTYFFEQPTIYEDWQLVPCPPTLARPLCAVRACHNLRQSRAASRHIFGGKSLTTWCIKLHSIHQPSYYYCNTETIHIVLSFHITINGLNTSWIEVRIIPQTSYCSECNNEHFSLKLCEKVIQRNIDNWRHLNKSAKNHATFPHINRTVTQPLAAYEISKPLHSPVLGQMWNLQTSLYS